MDIGDTDGPSLTRRRALASAGALTLGVGGGAAAVSDLFANDRPYEGPWVARNNYFFQNGESRRDANFAISANTYLQYVDASWDPFGDPNGDGGGCWEHTFVLYSTAFALQPKKHRSDASPPVPDYVDYELATGPTGPESPGYIGDLGSELTVRSEQDHEAVSVSARRDGDLYHFVDPEQLTEELSDNPAMPNAHSYGPSGTDDYEDLLATTPGTDVNWTEAKMKERGEDGEAYLQAGMTSLGLALALTGVGGPLGTALFVAGTARGFLTLLLGDDESPEDGVSRSRGFENSTPKTGACAGHLLMFDVCVSPDQSGSFTVQSKHPKGRGRRPIEPMWEVELPDIEEPARTERDRRPFGARIRPPAPDSATNVQTDPTPNVAISPAPTRRTPGTELSFSGVDTFRGGAMIDSFDWTVYEYSGDPADPAGAGTGVSPSGPTFEQTFDAGAYVAELSVTDATGATGVARKPFEVGDDTAGPTARLSVTPSTIEGSEIDGPDDLPVLTFDGTASSDDLGIVEHQWRFPTEDISTREWDIPTIGTQRAYGRPTTLQIPVSQDLLSRLPVSAELTVWDRTGRSSTTSTTVSFEGGEQ